MGERSGRPVEDERLTAKLRKIFAENYECYGVRRMHAALVRDGERVGRDQVARLMRVAGLRGAKRRGKPWRTTIGDPAGQKRPDLVKRDFTATAPDRLWVGDFTYLRTWEGKVHFSFVIDVYSRMIVGWQLATHMRTDLVLDALRMALSTRHRARTSRLWRIRIRGRSTSAGTTRSSSTTRACWRRSGRSAMPTTTRWPNHSWTRSKTELIKDRVWHLHEAHSIVERVAVGFKLRAGCTA